MHANNWSLTLAFHIIYTQAPVNMGTGPGMPGCSYATHNCIERVGGGGGGGRFLALLPVSVFVNL